MIAPSTAFSGEAGRYPWYRVSFVGGVDLRQGPSVEAPRSGETLCQNATFAAAEELLGADGRVYLRLADGRGWALTTRRCFLMILQWFEDFGSPCRWRRSRIRLVQHLLQTSPRHLGAHLYLLWDRALLDQDCLQTGRLGSEGLAILTLSGLPPSRRVWGRATAH